MSEDKNKEYENEIQEENDNSQVSSIPIPTAIPIIIFFFALGLVLGGFFLPLGTQKPCKTSTKQINTSISNKAQAGPIVRLNFRIPSSAPYIGKKDAPITILAFDDFQCPFCKRFFHVVEKVMKDYPNDVKFVFMNFPLNRIHKSAQLAAEVGMEAMAQGKFAQMHEFMFENQRKITRENVEKWAAKAGMDVNKLKQALDSGKYKKLIRLQATMGKSIGVRGTPTVLVNGRKFNMNRNEAQSIANLKKLIQEELQIIKTKKIPRAKAYAMLTRNGVRRLSQLNQQRANRKNPRKNRKNRRKRRTVDPTQIYKVVYDKSDPYKGSENALVTIVEFSDFKCPFCHRAEKTMDQILETFKGKVKLVYMQNPLPFHKHSKLASETALEVFAQKGMKAYWDFHKKLFEHSREINPDNLKKWAKEAGLNMKKYEESIKNHTHSSTIARHQQLANKFGARGTPSFFVNGYYVRGARPFDSFKPVIEREIKKAETAINAKKADLSSYYSYIMQKALPAAKYIGGNDNNKRKRPRRPRLDTSKVYKIWPLDNIPFWGDPNAQVVVALGLDIQCPWCKKIVPILEQLYEGNQADKFAGYKTGVKFVFLHFPLRFHKNSQLAHEAMQEVFIQKGPKVFYKYMKKLFENQKQLQRENLEKWASELNINMKKFKKALDNHTHAEFIKKVTTMARNVGIRGTPTVYINGKQARGRAYQIYKKLINQAMETARKYITEHKISPKKYYEELMKTAEPKAVFIQPGGQQPNKRHFPVNIRKIAPNAKKGLPIPLKIRKANKPKDITKKIKPPIKKNN